MAKNNRESLIDSIMKNNYGDDDPKYDGSNRAFLESLTLKELQKLDNETDDEEFDVEGEIMDFDCDDEEVIF